MKTFYQLLVNTLASSVINFTIWFAITFFVFLETHSVFATAIISGIYLVLTAVSGIWFGSMVDHSKKKHAMLLSSSFSMVLYAICFVIYQVSGREAFKDPASITLWVFVVLLMIGVIIGNIRTIALPTLITILIPEDKRDKANGLAGTTSGVSFLITSVISGFLVGISGMYHALILAIGMTVVVIIHLLTINIPEKQGVHVKQSTEPAVIPAKEAGSVVMDMDGKQGKVDLRGTIKVTGVSTSRPLI